MEAAINAADYWVENPEEQEAMHPLKTAAGDLESNRNYVDNFNKVLSVIKYLARKRDELEALEAAVAFAHGQ